MATRVKPGTRVRVTPAAQMRHDTEADLGTVRDVRGTGATAVYEVDATDRTGYRTALRLARSEFTLYRPGGVS